MTTGLTWMTNTEVALGFLNTLAGVFAVKMTVAEAEVAVTELRTLGVLR